MLLKIQNYYMNYFKTPERISLFQRQIQFNIQINSKAISKVNIIFIIPFLFPFLPFSEKLTTWKKVGKNQMLNLE